MSETYSLKNHIDMTFIKNLSADLQKADPKFQSAVFLKSVKKARLDDLELKQRIRLISTLLFDVLPGPYVKKIALLKKVAASRRGLGGLIFPDFVELHGQQPADFAVSVEALKYFTPFSSSEFAIRPFIEAHPQRMMKTLLSWSKDKSEHVRRLASEGCRPRLPWSFKLRRFVADPAAILPILNNLKADDSLYVRKSVANNLNDISKDHPELVLNLAKKWIGKNKDTDWILKHALRTLLKAGDQRALKLFGVSSAKNVRIDRLAVLKNKNAIGSKVQFEFVLLNTAPQMIRLEYAIHYLKKNNSYSKKVFKISEKEVGKGSHHIARSHSLRQMTTRKHLPGLHKIDIIINGQVMNTVTFFITA